MDVPSPIAPFHYHTGEPVKSGDKVRLGEWDGYIGLIIQPGTADSRDYSCENTGGVFFTSHPEDLPGWILLSDPANDEDLAFISRDGR